MSISEKQLQANRCNALKSTGPRTAEGLAVSSKNALKHGLLSAEVVYYSEFGDKGDGKADDIDAVIKAHNNANRHGLAPSRFWFSTTTGRFLPGKTRSVLCRVIIYLRQLY